MTAMGWMIQRKSRSQIRVLEWSRRFKASCRSNSARDGARRPPVAGSSHPDRRMREGCPDVLAHGSAPVTADYGEGIEGHTERAGLEVCLTYWAVSHATQPYPIQVSEPIGISFLRHVWDTYPRRIRHVSDTLYASL